MKTVLYLDGKRTSKKHLKALVGEERLESMLEKAAETFREDPLIQNDFCLGRQMLTVEFKQKGNRERPASLPVLELRF